MIEFTAPAAPGSSGENFNNQENEGDLLALFKPEKAEVETRMGVATIAKTERIDNIDTGVSYTDAWVFGTVIVKQLTDTPGEMFLGRLGRGVASEGRSAPWILEDPTEADRATATAFYDTSRSTHRDIAAAAAEENF